MDYSLEVISMFDTNQDVDGPVLLDRSSNYMAQCYWLFPEQDRYCFHCCSCCISSLLMRLICRLLAGFLWITFKITCLHFFY